MTDWPAVLLRVRRPPGGHDLTEVLELALAGAALEVGLGVLFEADGTAHLLGAAVRPWRQFPDFDLGRLYLPADEVMTPDVQLQRLDAAALTALLTGAGKVIDV